MVISFKAFNLDWLVTFNSIRGFILIVHWVSLSVMGI